jgi:hypothetical protein
VTDEEILSLLRDSTPDQAASTLAERRVPVGRTCRVGLVHLARHLLHTLTWCVLVYGVLRVALAVFSGGR